MLCVAPGCRRAAQIKKSGLCLFHYGRKHKGVPLGQPKQRHRKSTGDDPAIGCRVLGCGKKVAALGMCWGHYRRDLRGAPVNVHLAPGAYGHAVKFGPPRPPYRVRRLAMFRLELQTNWTPCPMTGCWLWLGEHLPTGYGRIGRHDDPWSGYAHRAVLHFAGARLVRGTHHLHVRHKCNQRACVNPAHLAYGTAAENMADRTLRYERGELKPRRRGLAGQLAPRSQDQAA
jgi:hypothetical protein